MSKCKACADSKKGRQYRLCKCCALVDKDFGAKWVRYCNFCGVWLCDACMINPVKRVLAFGKQFFE